MIAFIFGIFRVESGASLTTKIVSIALALFGALQINNFVQRSIGRQQGEIKAIEKVKKANDIATTAGQKAAHKSGNPAPRGRKRQRLHGYRD